METEITAQEARWFLRSSDQWGTTRIYGVIADGDTAGQIVGIKSEQNLDRFTYSRIYTVTTTVEDIVGG